MSGDVAPRLALDVAFVGWVAVDRRGMAAAIVAGVGLDALLADPRRGHPVAAFGRSAAWLERRMYADSCAWGLGYAALSTLGVTSFGLVIDRTASRHPAARFLVTAIATWAVVGGTELRRQALRVADALDKGELHAARQTLPSLCGRDPDALDAKGLVRATVESVAENTSDAVVAPLFWGALCGPVGMLTYRSINTLDAMVGHRSPRYARFGLAAARLDDLANLIPARLTGLLASVCGPIVDGDPRTAYGILRRYGHRHPSPNAGRCEAAFAGALGVRLGGSNVYQGRVEHRPELGEGRTPEPYDIRRAVRLSRAVTLIAAALAAMAARRGSGRPKG